MSQGPNLSHIGPIGPKPSNINQLKHKDQPHGGAGSAMKGKFNVFHLTRYCYSGGYSNVLKYWDT